MPFDDVDALETAVHAHAHALAAIVIEPIVEQLPSAEWLQAARRLCDAHGALLVFDEVKTGCRVHVGGLQATPHAAGVVPDLATFGKALANGYPLSAVVGSASAMEGARRAWVSSTLASEGTALAAAHAVLDRHAAFDVCARLAHHGAALRSDVAHAAIGLPGVQIRGHAPMWFVQFTGAHAVARETRFLDAARRVGVLFKRGAYNYATLAHDASIRPIVTWAAIAGFSAVREFDALQ